MKPLEIFSAQRQNLSRVKRNLPNCPYCDLEVDPSDGNWVFYHGPDQKPPSDNYWTHLACPTNDNIDEAIKRMN